MTQHLNRTAWVGILVGLAGFALLYIGLTEYLREPGLEPAATVGLGILALVVARQAVLGSSEKGKEAAGNAWVALVALSVLPGMVRESRTDPVVLWIFVVTSGVIVLAAATAAIIKFRKKKANQAASPDSPAAGERQ